jgi:hypothetical protein
MVEDSIAERIRKLEQAVGDPRHGTLASHLKSLDDSVTKLRQDFQDSLGGLRRELRDYIDEDRSRQSAQTALLEARAQLDREFGHRQVTRRSATGILQALDTGIVAPAALLEAAGRLMLDTPDYWLPPALVAVVAWIGDGRTVAQNAMVEATRCDAGRTALFFSLMAARYARHDAAGQWLDEYLCSLDCRSLTVDSEAVLNAAAQSQLGGPARDRLIAVGTGWREQLGQDSELANRQVERWQAFIRSKRQRLDSKFSLLPKMTVGSDWDEKRTQLEANAVFRPLRDWLDGPPAVASPGSQDPAASIDALLQSLVAAPDDREAELLRVAEERQAAVEKLGNRGQTTAKPADRKQASPPERDFLTLLTEAALSTPAGTPPARAPLLALTFSGTFIKAAINMLRQDSERSKPGGIEVTIDGWRRDLHLNDNPEEHAREYAEFIRGEMRKAPRMRLSIRREDVRAKWEEREKAGRDEIHRVVDEVVVFFAEWERGTTAASECVTRIDNFLAAGADPATESASAGGSPAPSPPDWDLLPPTPCVCSPL